MSPLRLRYGNTNTFFIPGGLLVDTDWAGTMGAFYRALKGAGIQMKEIACVLATHYHPDHMGLVGALQREGVTLLLLDVQRGYFHGAEAIFAREKRDYVPVDEARAVVVSCAESRGFLARMGIEGEILHTPSHSPDSVSLLLDNGDCLVGDLEPFAHLEACPENAPLQQDWQTLRTHRARRIYYAHRPEMGWGE